MKNSVEILKEISALIFLIMLDGISNIRRNVSFGAYFAFEAINAYLCAINKFYTIVTVIATNEMC